MSQIKTLSLEDLRMLESYLQTVVQMVMLIPIEHLETFLGLLDRQETMMPIVSPTQFIQLSEQLARGGEVARATLRFRRELEQIKSCEER